MILLRAAVAETNPQVVDTTNGFDPRDLLPLSEVSRRMMPLPVARAHGARPAPRRGEEVADAMRSLSAVLPRGAARRSASIRWSAPECGLAARITYGMTETSGGCVRRRADACMTVRARSTDGRTRLAFNGPTLMTRYLDAESLFFEEGGHRWLISGEGASFGRQVVEVNGRAGST